MSSYQFPGGPHVGSAELARFLSAAAGDRRAFLRRAAGLGAGAAGARRARAADSRDAQDEGHEMEGTPESGYVGSDPAEPEHRRREPGPGRGAAVHALRPGPAAGGSRARRRSPSSPRTHRSSSPRTCRTRRGPSTARSRAGPCGSSKATRSTSPSRSIPAAITAHSLDFHSAQTPPRSQLQDDPAGRGVLLELRAQVPGRLHVPLRHAARADAHRRRHVRRDDRRPEGWLAAGAGAGLRPERLLPDGRRERRHGARLHQDARQRQHGLRGLQRLRQPVRRKPDRGQGRRADPHLPRQRRAERLQHASTSSAPSSTASASTPTRATSCSGCSRGRSDPATAPASSSRSTSPGSTRPSTTPSDTPPTARWRCCRRSSGSAGRDGAIPPLEVGPQPLLHAGTEPPRGPG